MKNKKLIKLFLVLALAIASSGSLYASEVTGTLSSAGNRQGLSSGGSNGSAASGVVVSPSPSGGFSLGASTSNSTSRGSFASSQTLADNSTPSIPSYDASSQTAAATYSGFSTGTWIWIILLVLLLVGIITYSYRRSHTVK
jgi:hypothetical protein